MKLLLILLLVFGLFTFTEAQEISVNAEKSTLRGTVTDINGAVLVDARVNLVGRSGRAFSTSTNDQGVFQIEVNPDIYRIEFSREYFQTYKIEGFRVANRSRMQLDVALNVAPIIDTVDIPMSREELKQVFVSGTVYDPGGAAVSGTEITVRSQNKTVFQTKTNADGRYEVVLMPGRYSVEFSSPGFKRTVIDDIRVVNTASRKIQRDVVMEIGSVVNSPIVVPPSLP